MSEYTDPDGRPLYGSARCFGGHPLWLVAEGYAYCRNEDPDTWFPWRLTPPGFDGRWTLFPLEDRTPAWVGNPQITLAKVLKIIQEDMDAHRQLAAVNHVEAPAYAEWLASVR